MDVQQLIKYLFDNQRQLFSETTKSKLGQANYMGQQMMFNAIIKVLSNLEEE